MVFRDHKIAELTMRLFLIVLVVLFSNTGYAQQKESFKFLKKNHKLNRGYQAELNQKDGPLFVSSHPQKIRQISGKKEKLNIYPLVYEGDPRLVNPDLHEIRYEYRKFNMGNLIPNVLRPVGININTLD